MLEAFAIVIMLMFGLLLWRAGLWRGVLTLVNVLLSGFIAFNFWEPIARSLGSLGPGLDAAADAVVLVALFLVAFGILHLATALLSGPRLGFRRLVQQIGGAVCGLWTGYFVAGMLICTLQTLPFPERFLNYDPEQPMGVGAPDRVWLAMMHRASGVVFDRDVSQWFDADGSFIARYARYRRTSEGRAEPLKNRGEFPPILESEKPRPAPAP